MFEIKGLLKEVKETIQVSDKFKKREFVLVDDSTEYPQTLLFQLTQDNCAKMDSCKANDRILVKFNLRGREWTNPQGEVKVFNSLDAWFIQKEDANTSSPAPQPVDMSAADDSDLPF